MNPHNAILVFGRFKQTLLTRIPFNYLRWGITTKCDGKVRLSDGNIVDFHEIAKIELERRGERIDVDISPHAIDRISQKFLNVWMSTRTDGEGIYSWAQRVVLEAMKEEPIETTKREPKRDTYKHLGRKWVIQDMVVPVLITIK